MEIQPEIAVVTVGMLEVNCIIVHDPETMKGIIVDPGDEPERIVSFMQNNGIIPESIVLTHGHGDHIGAVDILRDELSIPVAIGRLDADMLTFAEKNLSADFGIRLDLKPADRLLEAGDKIHFGRVVLDVFHTPGHTRGSVTLATAGLAIVGDLVFCGSVGRVDLPGGSFQQLLTSIRERILSLPDDTLLYPGHGPVTTVGNERISNPFLTGAF
ncbi:MAG: MBL fold metallo-hydrolase [Candidatus Zixiibacteriota bacterium]